MTLELKRGSLALRIPWRWIFLALILALYFQQMRGCVMVFSPKVGRVVDVTTGKGIPHAAVIAAALLRSDKAYGGDGVYRVITYTDADGNYRVPNTWSHAFGETLEYLITMRAAGPHVVWVITALKPGYAFVGDEDAWLRYYENTGEPRYRPLSTAAAPEASWHGFEMAVAPMLLKPVHLNVKQATSYFHAIVSDVGAAGGPDMANKSDEARLRRPIFDYLLPMVCGAEPNTTVDAYTASAISDLSDNGDKYLELLRKLEPDGFEKPIHRFGESDHPIMKSLYNRYRFATGSICSAMNAGGEKQ